MRTEIPLLQNVRVAAPCSASWSAMTEVEGDRVRFCDSCRMNVYNLSAMGQAEAEGLLRRHEGRLCVRYFRRRDGTVLTKDCPVGKEAVRLMFLRRSVATAALFIVGLGVMKAMEINTTTGRVFPHHEVVPESKTKMGAIYPKKVPEGKPDVELTMSSLPALATPTKPVEVMGEPRYVEVGRVVRPTRIRQEMDERVGKVERIDATPKKCENGGSEDK